MLLEDGKVAFLDFGMTKRLDPEQIRLEEEVVKARLDKDPERLREKLHDLGFLRNPKRIDAEQLMAHVDAVGGWYLVQDEELEITPEYVMSVITAISDPRSDFYALMRRENVPANELMGRRMEVGVLAVLGQLRARRNWHRIAREWWFGDEPQTELGRLEHEFWARRASDMSPFPKPSRCSNRALRGTRQNRSIEAFASDHTSASLSSAGTGAASITQGHLALLAGRDPGTESGGS